MELIDNINHLLGDDLKQLIKPGSRLKIAASCFSIYAFEALKAELEKIEDLSFIFTSPTFVADEVADKIRKERREFHIPKGDRERSLYGSEFEIQLRNKLTQRAIAKECAEWMRCKATFKSNRSKAPMQQFACVQSDGGNTAYMPLHGFTAVDLGYQQGNAVITSGMEDDEGGELFPHFSCGLMLKVGSARVTLFDFCFCGVKDWFSMRLCVKNEIKAMKPNPHGANQATDRDIAARLTKKGFEAKKDGISQRKTM